MFNNLLYVLTDFALFGGLILLIGCAALRFFQQPVERLRIIEWTLAGCLLAPLLQQIPGVPRWSLGIWPREAVAAAEDPMPVQAPSASDVVAMTPDEPPVPTKLPPTEVLSPINPASDIQHPASAETLPRFQWSWPLAIVAAFTTGSLCMAAWLVIGMFALGRISRRSRPAPERVHELFRAIADKGKHIHLAVTDHLALPIAFGILRPTILLPAQLAETATDADLRFCLAHEYSHVRNSDIRRWRICTLIGLVFFYQPLYWILRRQLRLAQDYLADNHAAQTAEPTDYASFLVSLAHHRLGLAASAGLSIGDGKSNLYRRVTALLEDNPMLLRSRRAWNVALVILALSLIASISTIRIHAKDENQPVTSDGTKLDSYGDAIPKGALARMGTVRLRHMGRNCGVAFAPDGNSFVSFGWDRLVRIWNTKTGAAVKQLVGTVDRPTFGAAYSPDGKRLATVGANGLLRVWDVTSGQELWKALAKGDRIFSVVFAPDGMNLATGGDDGVVRLWDSRTAEELLSFDTKQKPHNSHAVAFSPDGKLLASGTGAGIQIYNLENGREQVIKNAHRDVISIAFTADGKQIISSGQSQHTQEKGEKQSTSKAEAKLWQIDGGKLVREFIDGKKQPGTTTSALSTNGKTLVSVFRDKIRVWNVATSELTHTISDYSNTTVFHSQGVAISPDGKWLAAIGNDSTVRVWDLETGKPALSTDSHTNRVDAVACSPKSSMVVSGGADGSVRLWDLATGKQTRICQLGKVDPREVHAVEFSPDGEFVAAGGFDWKNSGDTGIVSVWKVADGSPVWSKELQGRVTRLKFSADGRRLAVAAGLGDDFPGEGQESTLRMLDASSGNKLQEWTGFVSKVCAFNILKDASEVTIVEEEHLVSVCKATQPDPIATFDAKTDRQDIQSATFSPDGNTLVASEDHEDLIVVWDVKAKSELHRLRIKGSKGNFVAISPDGQLLATGAAEFYKADDAEVDRAIHFWNLATRKHLGQIDLGQDSISSLTFSPDGRKLISGMNDGTLLVWEIAQLKDQARPADDKSENPPSPSKSQKDGKSVGKTAPIGKSKDGAEPITYTGIVQEKETAKPIAGATVTVRTMKDVYERGRGTSEANYTTDASGEFTFTIPAELADEDQVYSHIRARHPRYAGATGGGFIDLAGKRDQASPRRLSRAIELLPGKAVTGVVTTPDRKPAAKIMVRGYSDFLPGADRPLLEFGRNDVVRTDEQGRFSLMMLDPGVGVFWILPEKGFAPSQHTVGEKRGDMGTFELQRGQSISGRLVDVDGKPIPGVYVHADSNHFVKEGFAQPVKGQFSRCAICDANGEFKMEPLPPGKYRLEASDEYFDLSGEDRDKWLPRHVPPAVFLPKEVTLVAGQPPAPVELRAVPHVLIEAQVVDSQGKPRSGFRPEISGLFKGRSFNPRAEITPNGKITARAPRGMDVAHIGVQTDQKNSFRWRLGKDKPWKAGHSIELGPVGEGISGIEVMYYRAPALLLKVVDKAGKTRQEAEVTAFYAKGTVPSSTITQKRNWLSDVAFDEESDGQFRSKSLLPDEEITVTAYANGLASPPQKIKLTEGEQKEITLVLDKAAPGEGPISVGNQGLFLKVDATEEEEADKPKPKVEPNAAEKPQPKSDSSKLKPGKDDNTKADKPEHWDPQIDIVVQGNGTRVSDRLPAELGKQIKQIDGVKDVCGGSVDLISFSEEKLISVPVNGWPLDGSLWKRLEIKAGRILQKGDDRHALLGHELADKLKKRTGDTVEMYGNQFKIVGVYESYFRLENQAVVLLLDKFQELAATGNTVTGFTVELKDRSKPGELERVCQQIRELLPGKIRANPVGELFRGDININEPSRR